MLKRPGGGQEHRQQDSAVPDRTPQGAVINSYIGGLRRMRGVFVMVGLFSAVINVLMLTGSIYMLQVYDRVLSSGSVPTLMGLFAIVVVLFAFLAYYDFLRVRSLARAAIRLDRLTATATFRAWVRSGLPGDSTLPVGGQPLRDLELVRGFLSGQAILALFDIPFVPLYLAILFVVHPWLGWLTVGGAAVVAALAVANKMVTKASIAQAMALDGTERDFVERGRRDAEVIHGMGMQDAITARWAVMHEGSLAAGQAGSDPSEVLAATSRAFRMLLQSAMLTLGAYLVLRGEISGGMIIASSILSGRALAPVDQIIGQWRSVGRAAEAHRRLNLFFEGELAAKARIDLPSPTGRISLSRVSKLAPGKAASDSQRILHQVSFELAPGDGLGVIGNSASGKSTLARLLVGAWAPDSGEIRMDGATLDQWDPAKLGRAVGYLPQTLAMLPGTIRDNIARFDPAADDATVIAAAKLAGVHEMILKLPAGYATQIGGDEMPLSGGQVQRLGLARAVYGMPKLVVLDEPNSNLDVTGDDALAAAITTLRAAGSVVVVMAHRPSAIAAVNKVLILHGGMVAQFGDKAEILAGATVIAPALASAGPIPEFRLAVRPDAQLDGPLDGTMPEITENAVTETETGDAEAAAPLRLTGEMLPPNLVPSPPGLAPRAQVSAKHDLRPRLFHPVKPGGTPISKPASNGARP
jgi:ATP-binding cassette subfamily C exporter for protease/lipase